MMQLLDEMNFFDPETARIPFAFYEAARKEAPVYKLPNSPFPGKDVFLVTSYDLVQRAARDWQTFSNRMGTLLRTSTKSDPEIEQIQKQGYGNCDTLLTQDPPLHKQYRSLVNKAFNAKRVNGMKDYIKHICDELIDKLADRGTCDFFAEFAVPLPVYVIADQLGVRREDLDKFKRWSDSQIVSLSQLGGRNERLQAERDIVELQHYFAEVVEARRGDPKDDIISDLANVELEEESRLLDMAEILSIVQQLLVAGNETTRNALAGGMVYVIEQPGMQDRLAADPSLIPGAVEEILRLEAGTKHMWRVVTTNTELGGVDIPSGSAVLLSFDGANRDPEKFPDPHAVNFERHNAASHMSFGLGMHFCVGALLARQEMTIAFECLFSRLKNWDFAPDMGPLKYLDSVMHRGLLDLRLAFDKRTD